MYRYPSLLFLSGTALLLLTMTALNALGQEPVTLSIKCPMTNVVVSPDGKLVASLGETIRLYEPISQREQQRFPDQGGSISTGRFSADGKSFALSKDIVVRIWDTQTGKEHPQLQNINHRRPDVVLSPDSRFAALADARATVRLWDISKPPPR